MNTIARKQKVMARLEEEGSVNIAELAEELNVSSMTIRRDLAQFQKQGLVTMEYGGAVLNSGSLFEYDMTMKKEQNLEAKRKIAQKCAEFVKDGESIFIDAGTTTAEIAKLIINRKNLNVMTNSLLAANYLSKAKNLKVVMCPGVFRETSMAYMGKLTDDFIQRFRIDVLFLGVEGIELNSGVSVQDITDGETKQTLARHAQKVVCAADKTKFGKSYFYQICPLSQINVLVTDEGLDPQILEPYREVSGLEIVEVK